MVVRAGDSLGAGLRPVPSHPFSTRKKRTSSGCVWLWTTKGAHSVPGCAADKALTQSAISATLQSVGEHRVREKETVVVRAGDSLGAGLRPVPSHPFSTRKKRTSSGCVWLWTTKGAHSVPGCAADKALTQSAIPTTFQSVGEQRVREKETVVCGPAIPWGQAYGLSPATLSRPVRNGPSSGCVWLWTTKGAHSVPGCAADKALTKSAIPTTLQPVGEHRVREKETVVVRAGDSLGAGSRPVPSHPFSTRKKRTQFKLRVAVDDERSPQRSGVRCGQSSNPVRHSSNTSICWGTTCARKRNGGVRAGDSLGACLRPVPSHPFSARKKRTQFRLRVAVDDERSPQRSGVRCGQSSNPVRHSSNTSICWGTTCARKRNGGVRAGDSLGAGLRPVPSHPFSTRKKRTQFRLRVAVDDERSPQRSGVRCGQSSNPVRHSNNTSTCWGTSCARKRNSGSAGRRFPGGRLTACPQPPFLDP